MVPASDTGAMVRWHATATFKLHNAVDADGNESSWYEEGEVKMKDLDKFVELRRMMDLVVAASERTTRKCVELGDDLIAMRTACDAANARAEAAERALEGYADRNASAAYAGMAQERASRQKAEAENKRLREAMDRIANGPDGMMGVACRVIALDALDPEAP